MIHVIATIRCRPGHREEVLAQIHANLAAVRAEDGCLLYQPSVEMATGIAAQQSPDPDCVVMLETWESEAHLAAHFEAPHMRSYRERVEDLVAGVELRVLTPA